MVVVEGVGDDWCGHFEDVLVHRGDAACDVGNSEGCDQGAERCRVHRLTGAAAGEQPVGVAVGGGVHVGSLADPGQQQLGDRAGDRGWWFADAQGIWSPSWITSSVVRRTMRLTGWA